VDQATVGRSPIDFFGFQEFAHHRKGKKTHNGQTVLGEFLRRTAASSRKYKYKFIEKQGWGDWYGVQVVYNADRFDLRGNLSFKPEVNGESRPCAMGLFKVKDKRLAHVYGIVTSCHLAHAKNRGDRKTLFNSLRSKYDEAKKQLVDRHKKIGFEILMGDFNEVGHHLIKGRGFSKKFLEGWTAPNDHGQKTLGSRVPDKIVYTHGTVDAAAPSPSIETFPVENPAISHRRRAKSTSRVRSIEVSDHRPRKLTAYFRI